jgi:hypothetical protein
MNGDFLFGQVVSMLKRDVVLTFPFVCLAAAGCGQADRTPAPPAVAPAFVFVLSPQDKDKAPAKISVFQVDPNGDLQMADQRPIEDAEAMAADPKGRFVFVGGGKPERCPPSQPCTTYPGYLRTYAVDAVSGVLSQSSERTMPSHGIYQSSHRYFFQVKSLAASEDTVYAMVGTSISGSVLQFHIDAASGALGDALDLGCEFDERPRWMLPAGPRLLLGGGFVVRCGRGDPGYWGGAFGVYEQAPEDGGLRHVAKAALAESSRAYGNVGAKAGNCVVAGWSGSGPVNPDGTYPTISGATPFTLDPASGVPTQRNTVGDRAPEALAAANGAVAVAITTARNGALQPVSSTLDLYGLMPTCELVPTWTSSGVAVISLAFHPDGRFFYAARHDGIRTYAQLADGSWEARGFIAGVTGTLVAATNPRATP